MSCAHDHKLLPPLYTDSDWRFGLGFFGADLEDPQPFPWGTTFSLYVAPAGRGRPAAGDVHVLTAARDARDGHRHIVQLSSLVADDVTWTPGTYDLLLRATTPGAQVEALYAARLPVTRGLSQAVALGGASQTGLTGGAGELRAVLRDLTILELDAPALWPAPSLDFSNPDNLALGLIMGVL